MCPAQHRMHVQKDHRAEIVGKQSLEVVREQTMKAKQLQQNIKLEVNRRTKQQNVHHPQLTVPTSWPRGIMLKA